MKSLRTQLRGLWVGLALAALAGSASAASLEKLRVGQHPSFTRVVFELDAAAGYTVERRAGEDGTPLLIVRLDARLGPAAPRRVESRSALLESVTMTRQEERSVATLRLRKPGLPVKEMILRDPARIVLDVVGEDTALVQRPVRRAAAPPAAKPAPKVAKPAPEPPAETKPEPAPQATAAATPAPAPKAEPAPREAVARKVTKAPPSEPAPAEAAEAAPDPEAAKAEQAAREAMERRLAAVREAAEKRQRQLQAEKEAQRQAEAERQQAEGESEPAARPPAPEPSQEGLPSPLLLGGAVGLALALVVGLVMLFRRRSPPRKMELPGFGDEPEPVPSEEFEVGGASEPLVSGEAPPQSPDSGPGLFDEPDKGERSMESQVQVGSQQQAAPVARGGADVAQLVSELERRISQLESGLEEANAARERLERQVVAQSEELRVQRAAIARTQRALRGLSRSDEEQATEPALRD